MTMTFETIANLYFQLNRKKTDGKEERVREKGKKKKKIVEFEKLFSNLSDDPL